MMENGEKTALRPISGALPWKKMRDRPVQLKKQYPFNAVTLSGIVMLCRLLHSQNALWLIVVTLLGKAMDDRPLQYWKA